MLKVIHKSLKIAKYITLLFLISFSYKTLGDNNSLESDEAFVIIGIRGHLDSIHFETLDEEERFSVSKGRSPMLKLKRVKPGNYYVSSYRTLFANIDPVFFSKPSGENKFFKIEASSVNYLGEWFMEVDSNEFENSGDIDIRYSPKSISDYAEKNGYLKSLPLKVSTGNGKSQEFNWQFDQKGKSQN